MDNNNSETANLDELYDIDLKITEAEERNEEQTEISGCPKGYCKLNN